MRDCIQTLAQSQSAPVRWSGELLDRLEAERCRRLPRADLAERQKWRDRRLMALAIHMAGRQGDRQLATPADASSRLFVALDVALQANRPVLAAVFAYIPASQVLLGSDYPFGTSTDGIRGLEEYAKA